MNMKKNIHLKNLPKKITIKIMKIKFDRKKIEGG
jgi:hypothetical protein